MQLRNSILTEIYKILNNACRTFLQRLLHKYIWCILEFIECKMIKYKRKKGGSSESMIYCIKKSHVSLFFCWKKVRDICIPES